MFDYLSKTVPKKVDKISNFSRKQNPTFFGKNEKILIETN